MAWELGGKEGVNNFQRLAEKFSSLLLICLFMLFFTDIFALLFVTPDLESFSLVFTWMPLFSSKPVGKRGSVREKNARGALPGLGQE